MKNEHIVLIYRPDGNYVKTGFFYCESIEDVLSSILDNITSRRTSFDEALDFSGTLYRILDPVTMEYTEYKLEVSGDISLTQS